MIFANRNVASSLPYVIVFLGFVLILLRIDSTTLWDDEAQVAIISQNYTNGLGLSGFDGKHLLAYVNGTLLDAHGNYRNPPGDVWLTSLSFRLFGVGTWQARLPFAVSAFFCLIFSIRITKRHFPEYTSAGLFISLWLGLGTSFLLYTSQCRYYSLSMLCSMGAFLGYLNWQRNKERYWWLVFCTIWLICLYFSHYLLFVCFGFALGLQVLIFDRKDLLKRDWLALLTMAIIVLMAILPHAILHQIWHRPDFLWPSDTLLVKFRKLAWWNFRELSTIGLLPIPFFISAVFLAWNNEFSARVFAIVLAYGLALSILSPQPTAVCDYSDIRYMAAIFPLAGMLGAAFLAWIFEHGKLGQAAALLICTMVILHNGLAHNSFYFKNVWLLPNYVKEVSRPYPTATTYALQSIELHGSEGNLIRCIPDFFTYPLQFYAGQKYRFGSNLTPNAECWNIVHQKSPWYSTDSIPDLIFVFGNTPSNTDTLRQYHEKCIAGGGKGFYPVDTLPCFWPGLDASRPELWVHEFGPRYLTPQSSWEKIILWKQRK